jgi:serine/threonine-protein kinase
VTKLDGFVHFDDWAPDGRTLTVHRHLAGGGGGGGDVFLVQVDGEQVGDPQPFLSTSANETNAVFAPDGRFVAYLSTETGQNDVYIRPVQGAGARTPVSVGGGSEPTWARNGELFYRRLSDGRMMAVSVRTSPTLTVGPPRELFVAVTPLALGQSPRARYAVSSDGTRFIMRTGVLPSSSGSGLPTITVIQNWTEELKRLVP